MTWNAMKSQQNQEQHFTITVKEKQIEAPVSTIVKMIKEKMLRSPSIHSLLEEFEVSPEKLDDLVIEIIPLDKKYAETDLESMRLNTILFDTGDFFNDYYFVVPHELVHWLSRIKEEQSYFNDPEELLGFVMSVAAELERKTPLDVIWNRIYPKVSFHFHNENDAKECFENMIGRAKQFLSKGREIYAASILINSNSFQYPENVKKAMVEAYKQKSYRLVQKIASEFDIVGREKLSSKILMVPNPHHESFGNIEVLSEQGIIDRMNDIKYKVSSMIGPEGKVDDPNSPIFFSIEGVNGIFDSAAAAVKAYSKTSSNEKHTFRLNPEKL